MGNVAVLTSYQILKKEELTGPQFLEGDCWERGGRLFLEGLLFSHKK